MAFEVALELPVEFHAGPSVLQFTLVLLEPEHGLRGLVGRGGDRRAERQEQQQPRHRRSQAAVTNGLTLVL